jgi:hypothetical protein
MFPQKDILTVTVKITLNDSIPEARRPQVEKLVGNLVRSPEISWLPSRFPRLVMFVDPGQENRNEPEKTSIFEAPRADTLSPAKLTALLEDHIKALLKEPAAKI